MIHCKDCNKGIESIDWAAHKLIHAKPPIQTSIPFKPTKRLKKSVDKFLDTMGKLGGGSIGFRTADGKTEEVHIPSTIEE